MEENEQYSLKEELEKTLAGEAAEALRDRDSVEEKAEGSRDKAPVLSLQEEIEREDALSLQEEEDLLEALLFSLGRTVSLEENGDLSAHGCGWSRACGRTFTEEI